MRRYYFLLTFLLLCASLSWSQTTVTVTGNLGDILGTNVTTNAKVCFSLIDALGNPIQDPRTSGNVLISTDTVCTVPNGSGVFTTSVVPNDLITPANSQYSVQEYLRGSYVHGDNFTFNSTTPTYNLNTATPNSTSSLPVVPQPSSGGTAQRCIFTNAVSTWTCTENMGTTAVMAFFQDSNGVQIFPDKSQATDVNTYVGTWLQPQAGSMTVYNVGQWTPSTQFPNYIIANPTSSQTITGQVLHANGGLAVDGDVATTLGGSLSAKRIAGYLYPTGFGAVCDGSTDDSTAIQAALTEAQSNNESVVLAPAGKTCIATGLTFSGSHDSLVALGTLKKKANVDGVLLSVSGSSNSISGTFDCSNPAPTTNSDTNDCVQNTGGNDNIYTVIVNGAQGNGMVIFGGSRNTVVASHVSSANANDYFVACNSNSTCSPATDDNLVIGSMANGTTNQNCFFTTAAPGSLSTTNVTRRNRFIGNTAQGCGDSGFEAGIHSYDAVISGNTVKQTAGVGVLLRDAPGASAVGNIVNMDASLPANKDGIAVLKQVESYSSSFDTHNLIEANTIRGHISRSAIHIQQYGVTAKGNKIYNDSDVPNSSGVGLVGTGVQIDLPDTGSDINADVENNDIQQVSICVDTNFGAGAISLSNFTISHNLCNGAATGVNFFNVTFTSAHVNDNVFTKLKTVALNNSSATSSSSDDLQFNHYATMNSPGWSGATPVRANQAWNAGTLVETGSGDIYVEQTSPALITPTIGGGSTLSRYARYSINVGTLSAVAANTTAEQCVASALTSGDVVVGVSKPTAQAGLGLVGWRANGTSICLTFSNNTASPITPTASESYAVVAVQ